MTKLKIQEIIVVEGKDDTRRLQEVVDADTIETIGSAINEDILMQIEHAQETRGVIIFTDPDFSGRKNSENDHGSRATSQTCIFTAQTSTPT